VSGAAALADELRPKLLAPHTNWQAQAFDRDAAVLVPIVSGGAGVRVLIVRRRADLRHHAGQYAFPGGSRDGDESPMQCALRECTEELGLPPARVVVAGSLPCRRSRLGFLAHPFVGVLADLAGMRLQEAELDLAVEVDLSALQDQQRWQWRAAADGAAPSDSMSPFFTYGEHVIWGMTARIVADLVERWP
jgi:8-oxo-dGTP pyrophosphatase MutT (NUDIX family)